MQAIDVRICWAKRRIDVSRDDLMSAIALQEEAQEKHDRNVKYLRELGDQKFPETVGEW